MSEEDEVLHSTADQATSLGDRSTNGRREDRLREWKRRGDRIHGSPGREHSGIGAKPPALWGSPVAHDFAPEAIFGQYPQGFSAWAARVLHAQPNEVLHLCSGALPSGRGFRVDLRQAARPDVRADARCLPFRDASFRAVAIDPPYTVEYAADLYGVEYPRPSALLREAARVIVPGGRVGMLHFLVPSPVPGLRFLRAHGITTGCGYRIRAFTVFLRDEEPML